MVGRRLLLALDVVHVHSLGDKFGAKQMATWLFAFGTALRMVKVIRVGYSHHEGYGRSMRPYEQPVPETDSSLCGVGA